MAVDVRYRGDDLGVLDEAALRVRGDITFVICDALGNVVEERHERNLVCNAGLGSLTAALAYSGAADQQTNLGGIPPTSYMYPLRGAVGTASPTPSAIDTQLGAELARSTVAEASSSGQQVLFSFFFGTTASDWNVTECGVFCNSKSSANSGLLLNHSVFATVTKTASQTATMMVSFTFSN